jgi:dethiobiotin synthetase
MTTGFIITGTDTGVGKTVFAAALAAAIDGAYWKPVQAGLDEGGDTDAVARLSGLPPARIFTEAYRLTTPCSPHRAAEIDGTAIDPEKLRLPECDRPLIVEGAGGALVPLTRTLLYADMFVRWGLPVVIVARTALGTINHSLLTIEALRMRQILIHGIAFVGEANEDSEATICEIGEVRRLGRLPVIDMLSRKPLVSSEVETRSESTSLDFARDERHALANAFAAGFEIIDFIP